MQEPLNGINLNLFMILKALVKTQNTSQAAELLGLSQPSVSRGLEKLREQFGEQLFIRKAHGVQASEMAVQLAEATEQMLLPINRVLRDYQEFDPKTYHGELSIVASNFVLNLFGGELFNHLKKTFPAAKLSITYWTDYTIKEMLNGQYDYCIRLQEEPLPQDIFCQKIHSCNNVIIARKEHPVLSKSSKWQDIHELALINAQPHLNSSKSILENNYSTLGYQANIQLTTNNIMVANEYLKSSDAMMYAPQPIIKLLSDLQQYPLPPLDVSRQQTHFVGGYLQTRRNYPMYKLLHKQIKKMFSQL